ncbi:MAG: hypothetical protein RMM28_01830, partial [Thermoleophilia bacterium]|nr:hypothetical protein [Thermoleophilia bacterium]
ILEDSGLDQAELARALAEGHRPGDFVAVAITAPPCGGCRQWLLELRVGRVLFRDGDRVLEMTPDELLPESFGATRLDATWG